MAAVLVTGAASGIGKACAKYFEEKEYTVYALDKNTPEKSENIIPFSADIRDFSEMQRIADGLSAQGVVLDAIIAAAGIHDMLSLAEGDAERIERLIGINLTGTMLSVRAFHPLLKKSGRVIIVTSEVATYDPLPFNGLYNISKSALECYAVTLRQELNLIGQKVITVRPGSTATPLAKGSGISAEALAEETVLFKNQAKHFSRLTEKFTGTPIAPEQIAKLIYKAATKKRPRLSYAKNRHAGLVLLSLLPKGMQCRIVKMLLNRK